MTPILFIILAFIAEVAGTLVGFGSSTLLLPFAVLLFDFETALVLVAFLHIFGSLSKIGFFKHGLNWQIILRFGLPSMVMGLGGAMLVPYLDQNLLRGLLGVFLVGYVLASLQKRNLARASTASLVIGGSLSGFLAGLLGTGGALRGAFLNAYNLSKERYIVTAATTALMVDAVRITVYFEKGFLKPQHYWYLPVMLGLAVGGTWLGRQIVQHISQEKFKQYVLIGLFLIGIKLLYDWLF